MRNKTLPHVDRGVAQEFLLDLLRNFADGDSPAMDFSFVATNEGTRPGSDALIRHCISDRGITTTI